MTCAPDQESVFVANTPKDRRWTMHSSRNIGVPRMEVTVVEDVRYVLCEEGVGDDSRDDELD